MRYSCGHVSTKKNVRGIKDAATSTPPQLRSSRYIRYRDNIGYPRYGERYDIGDNQYSSNNLSYCPINRFLESVPTLTSAVRELMPMSFSVLGILCMILRISRTLRWPFGAFDISIDARICFAAFCSGAMNLHLRYVLFLFLRTDDCPFIVLAETKPSLLHQLSFLNFQLCLIR